VGVEADNLLDWLHDDLCATLCRLGHDPATAAREARAFCGRLQTRFKPGRYYLPAPDIGARDLAIVADRVAGLSVSAIADKHGVSLRTAKYVLAQAKETTGEALPSHTAVVPSDDPWA
jgi:hypothetical protein